MAIPMLGDQEAAKQATANQIILTTYLSIAPIVTQVRLGRGYDAEPGCLPDSATPEKIAEEAEAITRAVLKRVGLSWQKKKEQ